MREADEAVHVRVSVEAVVGALRTKELARWGLHLMIFWYSTAASAISQSQT